MREIPFKLDNSNNSITVKPDDNLYESHGLIYLSEIHKCNVIGVQFTNLGDSFPVTYAASHFKQIEVSQYGEITVQPTFIGAGYGEGSIFLGSWGETLLKEVELSLRSFFISYDSSTLNAFTIGAQGGSKITSTPDGTGNYRIVIEVVNTPTQSITISHLFRTGTPEEVQLSRLYELIRSSYLQTDFIERQNEKRSQLAEHLERRIRDGYNPSS